MRLRVAALVALVAGLVAVGGIAGWWYVKDRVRISEAAVESTVAIKSGGTKAVCDRTDANAAHWLCAVTITGSPARCMKAHVRPWGSVDIVNGYLKCKGDPALAALFVVPATAKHHHKKNHHKHRKQSGSA
jgi:hypothetical protein